MKSSTEFGIPKYDGEGVRETTTSSEASTKLAQHRTNYIQVPDELIGAVNSKAINN